MSFIKGKPKTGGRKPGTPNKTTGAFREAVQWVYNGLGGHTAFTKWAENNQTEFYRIAARLIPVEVHEKSDRVVNVYINRNGTPHLVNNQESRAALLPEYTGTDGEPQ